MTYVIFSAWSQPGQKCAPHGILSERLISRLSALRFEVTDRRSDEKECCKISVTNLSFGCSYFIYTLIAARF